MTKKQAISVFLSFGYTNIGYSGKLRCFFADRLGKRVQIYI